MEKKKIRDVIVFGSAVTTLLVEAMFNQDLKQEYDMHPDPPRVQGDPPGYNYALEETVGATGASGSGINVNTRGMLGGSYYGSSYYGNSGNGK